MNRIALCPLNSVSPQPALPGLSHESHWALELESGISVLVDGSGSPPLPSSAAGFLHWSPCQASFCLITTLPLCESAPFCKDTYRGFRATQESG